MPMPQPGEPAPVFQLFDQNGNAVALSQFAGRHVVLYFYPKDDTPGCTREACDFRDSHAVLQRAGAVVLGVSPDDIPSHLKFSSKYQLPFPLLADTGHQVAEAYGVWGEKSLHGRKFMGINRATFLIGPQGTVKHSWPKVKVENHVNEVLEMLQERPAAEVTNEAQTSETTPTGGAEEPTVGEAAEAMAGEAASKPRRARTAAKKGAAKKAPARKGAAKKGAAKKAPARKGVAKKGAAKKAPARKGAAKKGAAKKAPARQGAAKKGAARKAPARKGAAKKATAKRGAAKKGATRRGARR